MTPNDWWHSPEGQAIQEQIIEARRLADLFAAGQNEEDWEWAYIQWEKRSWRASRAEQEPER